MKTKEYRIFEVDKYGNKWFETSFTGNSDIQRQNAETFVRNAVAQGDTRELVIEEVG